MVKYIKQEYTCIFIYFVHWYTEYNIYLSKQQIQLLNARTLSILICNFQIMYQHNLIIWFHELKKHFLD